MENTKPQFPSTDAWVLTSIYGASLGGDTTLARIIGTENLKGTLLDILLLAQLEK